MAGEETRIISEDLRRIAEEMRHMQHELRLTMLGLRKREGPSGGDVAKG